MKKLIFLGALLSMLCLGACGGGAKSAAVADADTLVEKDTTPLPDTMYASVEKLQWRVEVLDSTVDGTLHVLDDPYLESNSKLAFRANHLRNADFGGKVKGVPTRIVKDWVFDTDVDYTPTKLGVWAVALVGPASPCMWNGPTRWRRSSETPLRQNSRLISRKRRLWWHRFAENCISSTSSWERHRASR